MIVVRFPCLVVGGNAFEVVEEYPNGVDYSRESDGGLTIFDKEDISIGYIAPQTYVSAKVVA